MSKRLNIVLPDATVRVLDRVTTNGSRIKAVVALAPAGNSKPGPGILKASLSFDSGLNVPTLCLAAASDILIPLNGLYELMERTRASKRLFVLRRSGHAHFLDNVEQEHERIRTMPAGGGDWAYMQKEIQPIEELCSGEEAHLFARGLTVAHFDAVLKGIGGSIVFWDQDIPGELKLRSVDAFESVGAV